MRSIYGMVGMLAAVACGGNGSASEQELWTHPVPSGGQNTGTGAGGGDGADASPPGDGGHTGTGGNTGTGGDIPCGVRSCAAGEFCCDGACGACAPVGMICPASPCGTR